MAKQVNQMVSVKFSCSICLDFLKNPVTIPCGHSYCLTCIKTFWNGEDLKGIYSCPQCRKDFIPRPDLVKNTMLAELVEELKETGLGAAPADHCYAGPEDVSCDVCTGRKLKAVKSCLVCLVSYCEKHLQPHHDAAQLKRHKLVEPSRNLQENICPCHDEVMKVFCRTDQQFICYLCLMDEHQGHKTVSVTAERAEKQKELEVSRQQIQQRIQDRQKDVELLQQEVEDINVSADKTVEDSEEIFTQLIRLIQERRSDVKQQVRSQQETEVRRVKELQEKLEQEITELKRKDGQLEQLSHTEDHKQFLHNYPSVSALSESPHSSSINSRPLRHFEDVTAAVSELRDKLQDVLRDTQADVSLRGTEVHDLLSEPGEGPGPKSQSEPQPKSEPGPQGGPVPEPRTRDGFLSYSRKITLDPNTAHTMILLSQENRKAIMTKEYQFYSDHPDRFTRRWQVLSKQHLTGRCYWEVEWSGTAVEVAVAYKSIKRQGESDESIFGLNDKSWVLCCKETDYTFAYNSVEIPIPGPLSSIIGVYLDHSAGLLSFYSVSDTMMTHLVTMKTTFTQPLYAGVWLTRSSGTTVEFIEPNREFTVKESGYVFCF